MSRKWKLDVDSDHPEYRKLVSVQMKGTAWYVWSLASLGVVGLQMTLQMRHFQIQVS